MGKLTVPKRTRPSRRRRSSGRLPGNRFVVATEGQVTEPIFIDSLAMFTDVGSLTVVQRKWSQTEPNQILDALLRYRLEDDRKKRKYTRYWMVFDHDQRDGRVLRDVANRAITNGIHIADSNPCFELWLLMRFGKLADFKGLEGRALTHGCDGVACELEILDKSYDADRKGKYDASAYMGRLLTMVENARADDFQSESRWLNHIGSRVYKLVEAIINSSANNPLH